MAELNPVSIKRYNFILNQVDNYADGKSLDILDVGCGHGDISIPLAKRGYKVTGIDIDKELVTECRNKCNDASFLVVDAQSEWDLSQYDVVIMSEVLEHISNPGKMIENMNHHLKPGGILVLTVPNGYCLTEILLCKLLNRKGKSTWAYKLIKPLYGWITGTRVSRTYPFYTDSPHLQFFTLKILRKLLNELDIRVVKNTDLGLVAGAGRMKPIKQIECNIANYLPHWLVGGWLMVAKKND